MAHEAWDMAMSGGSSNANMSNLSPAVSRIVVQGSRGISPSDATRSGHDSDSDSDNEADKSSFHNSAGNAGHFLINELTPVPDTRADASIMPAMSHAFLEKPTILSPMTVQLSPPSRSNSQPQEWTGGAMRVVDAVAALKTSAKVRTCHLFSPDG